MLALAMLALTTAAAAEPSEEEQEAGRTLAVEAMAAYKAGAFEKALESFNKAREVYATGQVLRMTGYTLIALERWLEAAEAIDEALATDYKPLAPEDVEDARGQLQKALEHLAVVSVKTTVDGAVLSLDEGKDRPLPATVRLEPGTHSFLVRAEGLQDAFREEELSAGQELSFEMDPTAPEQKAKPRRHAEPKPEPEEQSGDYGWFPGQGVTGLVTAGVGVVVAGVGIGSLAYGTSLRSAVQENIDFHNASYDAACTSNSELCRNDIALINADGERAQTHQNLGVVMTITGGALLAVGTTLFLFSADGPFAPDDAGAEKRAAASCTPALPAFSGAAAGGAAVLAVGMGCSGTF